LKNLSPTRNRTACGRNGGFSLLLVYSLGEVREVASPPSVFVSHTTRDQRDRSLAHYLAGELVKLGVKAWIAPESLPVGRRWNERLVGAILNDCSHFLVIVSAASMEAPWVLREIELARTRSESDPSFAVMPLIVGVIQERPELEFVRRFQSIPYSDDPQRVLQSAAAALGLRYTPPAQPADHLRAKEYLEKGIERDRKALHDIRRIRWAAPALGAAVAAGLLLGQPELARSWQGLLWTAPLMTGFAGWGATWQRYATVRTQLHKLEVMQDSLTVCMGAESDSCRQVWKAFWHYVETRALATA
jgi:hypothetical protein